MGSRNIRLLGTPQVSSSDGNQPRFRSQRTVALLGYLVAENRQLSREHLATLFWPDDETAKGRANLRRELHNLSQILPDCWEADRLSVRFAPSAETETDLYQLQTLINNNAWADASALAQGQFLEGVDLIENFEYETWLSAERERWRQTMVSVLEQGVEQLSASGDLDQATSFAIRLVQIDPWRESGHRQLMTLYAANGQRNRALAQFAQCAQTLQNELGVDPSSETKALAEQIRAVSEAEAETHGVLEKPWVSASPVARRAHAETRLLDKLQQFWIDGVLNESLSDGSLMRLSWQRDTNLVEHAWGDVVIPPTGTSGAQLAQEFVASDDALLILGAPGGGKTTSLLTLASDLLITARDDAAAAMPVLLNLSSWPQQKSALSAWITDELALRYQIPARLGEQWLSQDRLILLLDGLDEVAIGDRVACVAAINQFRLTNGLAGLVVCCRSADYAALPDRLRLNQAITLQPLSDILIRQHSDKHLATLLDRAPSLRELASSPLMFNIMRTVSSQAVSTQAVSTQAVAVQEAPSTAPDDEQAPIDWLFSSYIDQMLARPRAASEISAETLHHHLQWLAGKMQRQHQSTFLIEQLQPVLLSTWPRRAYMLLTRFLGSALLSIIIALLIQSGRAAPSPTHIGVLEALAAYLPLNDAAALIGASVLMTLSVGLLFGLLDMLVFEWRLRRGSMGATTRWRGAQHLAFNFVVASAYFVLVMVRFDPVAFIIAAVALFSLLMVLLFGYIEFGQSYETEIRTVEALGWSWRGAGWGMAIGLIVSAVLGLTLEPHMASVGLVPLLVGGLQRSQVEDRFRPNYGIRLSARNSLIGMLTFALIVGSSWAILSGRNVFTAWVIFGIIGWMVYGGGELIKHTVLRLLLWRCEDAPLNFAAFLDSAVAHALMRRVGGSYIFIHSLLRDHFARKP